MSPFLTIITGTYRRPTMLARCVESVRAQTDPDLEHIVLDPDEDGGIHGFHQRLGVYQDCYHGQYIYVLSDDDLLTDCDFVAELKRVCAECNPDVVMVKADKLEHGILPTEFVWEGLPCLGQVDMLNFVVRAPVWKQHSASFAKTDHPYHNGAFCGDFSFIWDVFESGVKVCWWDRLVAKSQRISRGRSE